MAGQRDTSASWRPPELVGREPEIGRHDAGADQAQKSVASASAGTRQTSIQTAMPPSANAGLWRPLVEPSAPLQASANEANKGGVGEINR